MIEMNEEIRADWCRALRSGKYEQGHHFLRRGDEWCALGVVLDVIGYVGVRDSNDLYKYGVEQNAAMLPDAAIVRCGLSDAQRSGHLLAITRLSDTGTPFPVIADFIDGGNVHA